MKEKRKRGKLYEIVLYKDFDMVHFHVEEKMIHNNPGASDMAITSFCHI